MSARLLISLFPEPLMRVVHDKLKSVQWMNEKATANKAYVPTEVEHIANVITHGVWILPSACGTGVLLWKSHTGPQYLAAIVYGLSLFFCFTVSTVFHCVCFRGTNRFLRDLFHRGDRAMIYIFIAASYFPWLILRPIPDESWQSHLSWMVWVMALFGIIYQQIFHERYKALETFFYAVVSIGPSIVFLGYHAAVPGEEDIKLGGLIYGIGVIFFKSDGKIPCAHAIWHLFVAGAASTHYFAILNNLYS